PKAVQGTFDVSIDDVKPLLPLVAPDLLAKVAAYLLGLAHLEARVAVYFEDGLQRVELLYAKSEPLQLRGHWQERRNEASGRFLLESGSVDFGLKLGAGKLDVVQGATEELLR